MCKESETIFMLLNVFHWNDNNERQFYLKDVSPAHKSIYKKKKYVSYTTTYLKLIERGEEKDI